jgi:hypothetical protein
MRHHAAFLLQIISHRLSKHHYRDSIIQGMQMITWYVDHLKRLKDTRKSGRLAIEISIVLIIKIILLWLLWVLCFSHPITKDARQLAVTRMILNHSK